MVVRIPAELKTVLQAQFENTLVWKKRSY